MRTLMEKAKVVKTTGMIDSRETKPITPSDR
jgi:hypothetical protein